MLCTVSWRSDMLMPQSGCSTHLAACASIVQALPLTVKACSASGTYVSDVTTAWDAVLFSGPPGFQLQWQLPAAVVALSINMLMLPKAHFSVGRPAPVQDCSPPSRFTTLVKLASCSAFVAIAPLLPTWHETITCASVHWRAFLASSTKPGFTCPGIDRLRVLVSQCC